MPPFNLYRGLVHDTPYMHGHQRALDGRNGSMALGGRCKWVRPRALAPGDKRGMEHQLPGERVLARGIDSSVSAIISLSETALDCE